MDDTPPDAHVQDCLERLAEEAAERLDQRELAARLEAMGETAPRGLLPTYHKLRQVLLSGNAAANPWTFREGPGTAEDANIDPLFDVAIFLFGLRRSGNHALVDWLKGHFRPEEVAFLNSADLAPFRLDGDTYSVDFGKYRNLRRRPGQRVLIVSYENLDPLLFPRSRNAGIAARSHGLILLRDLLNMAASIARSAREAPSFAYRYRLRDFPDLWCRYAHLHLAPPGGWKAISYNAWVENAAYRAHLQRSLGLPMIEVSRDHVSAIGGGSSFEGTSRDGEAAKMAVLRRWEEMQDDPMFQFLLLAEDEALDLNERLFGMEAPGRQEWLARWQNA